MSMKMETSACFTLCLFIMLAEGAYRNFKVEKLSATESQGGLGCAVELFGNGESLVVRYDTTTETCVAIPEIEVNEDTEKEFYKLRSCETSTADKGMDFFTYLPCPMAVGWSFIFELSTNAIDSTSHGFAINLDNESSGQGLYKCLHFNVRYRTNELVLNSMINGEWRSEEIVQLDYFHHSFMRYTLEFLVEAAFIKIYVDGQHIYDYNHRIDISTCDTIRYRSVDINCRSIERIYGA